MPCPECGDTCLTYVDSHVEYIEEPYIFQEGPFEHNHDSNPRVSIWKCRNGHEFQQVGHLKCKGCSLEQLAAEKDARKAQHQPISSSSYRPPINDHHHDLPNYGPRPDLC